MSIDDIAAEIADTRYDLKIRDMHDVDVRPGHVIGDEFESREKAIDVIAMILKTYNALKQNA